MSTDLYRRVMLAERWQRGLLASVAAGAYLVLPSGQKIWARAIAPWEDGCRLATVRVLLRAHD